MINAQGIPEGYICCQKKKKENNQPKLFCVQKGYKTHDFFLVTFSQHEVSEYSERFISYSIFEENARLGGWSSNHQIIMIPIQQAISIWIWN